MKKQKESSHEGITWSEMGKQNVQAKEVYCNRFVPSSFSIFGTAGDTTGAYFFGSE